MKKITTLMATKMDGTKLDVILEEINYELIAKLEGKKVKLDHVIKNGIRYPSIYLNEKDIKEIFGLTFKGGAHIILNKDWKPYEEEIKKERESFYKKEAEKYNIIGFVHEIGCDADSSFYFKYDCPEKTPWRIRNQICNKDNKLTKILSSNEIFELAEKLNAKKLPAHGGSYGGVEFDESNIDAFLKVAREKYNKIQNEKMEKTEKAKKERDKIFEKAKKTGKKVLLYNYSAPCTLKNEECDLDTINVYAMPDGTKTEKLHHNY